RGRLPTRAARIAIVLGMRHVLIRHPGFRCASVTDVAVEIERPRPSRLQLRYRLNGRIGGLRLPAAAASTRGDELWRHTCFEAFVRASSHAAYYEFNFSPSTQWAAYAFSSYRNGMEAAAELRE